MGFPLFIINAVDNRIRNELLQIGIDIGDQNRSSLRIFQACRPCGQTDNAKGYLVLNRLQLPVMRPFVIILQRLIVFISPEGRSCTRKAFRIPILGIDL